MTKQAALLLASLLINFLVRAQNPLLQAYWISPGIHQDSIHPCPVFQKAFISHQKIKSATLFITAHGLYEATINGRRVGTAYFTPGWTSYHHRLQYQQYDVIPLIKKGFNQIEVTVADGWWRGVYGNNLGRDHYGKDAGLLLTLKLTYTNGHTEEIVSDSTWQVSTGPILQSGIYAGETTDTRKKLSFFSRATQTDFSKAGLVATTAPPVTRQEAFRPLRIFKDPIGNQVIDFGQNLAGWVEIGIKGRAGDTIRISHTEVLDQAGNFYNGNLRDAAATDTYVLNGMRQGLEPHFTYHGFRYARVQGFVATKHNCTAMAVHSNLEHTGTFRCSNPLINQLQHNIEWSLNSNFLDIPTDCPQRSERLGWTGDAQVFCRTATYLRDVKRFYEKWLADLQADQGLNGGVPSIIPDLYRPDPVKKGGAAGWGDAATIVPWTLFEVYGDTGILRESYQSMKAWVDYIWRAADTSGLLWKARGYGDWYAPGPATEIPFIDECFFGYSTALLVKTATVLNLSADTGKYGELLRKIKGAFAMAYPAIPETQTAYTIALAFDMLPDSARNRAAAHLARLIHQNSDHLSTGFLGTPYLLPVLSRYGYTDLAYTLLNQTSPPSWLYPISKGATTVWEKWEAIKPGGSFDTAYGGETCSFNHYAYGAAGEWLYGFVAGIQPLEPGYRKILIAPHPGGGLAWVKAIYRCPYGLIECRWRTRHHKFILVVRIPKGTTAAVIIPSTHGDRNIDVGPGFHRLVGVWHIANPINYQ